MRPVTRFRLYPQLVVRLVLVVSMISWSSAGRAQPYSVKEQQIKQTAAENIDTLKVRIVTQRRCGAGTDNAVYFDIGPVAWKLGRFRSNDFEAGDDDTYDLKVPAGLTTDDILWVRLHKKGLLGITGTKDGLAGAWHPESVTLLVNGAEFVNLKPHHSLNSQCWYWRASTANNSELNVFARSLRMKANNKLKLLDRALGFFTTNIFKKNGISGWIVDPAEKECGSNSSSRRTLTVICVDGEITRKANSTDGLETIDMRVTQVESCPEPDKACVERVILDRSNGFSLARYIRIESRFRTRFQQGAIARVCGNLLWDTDREGWWEVHPRSALDLKFR